MANFLDSLEVAKEFFQEKQKTNWLRVKKQKEEIIEKLKKVEYYQTDYEKELYQKFCEIARSDPDKKFKFEHIEKLGLGADVVVIYGKKGIGKTYQISKIISELAKNDPKAEVILMRNTMSEFRALENQLSVDYCPVFMYNEGSNPKLWHKILRTESGKPRYMGFCTALNGYSFVSAKGGEFPNVRLIIWDECTNMGKGSGGYEKEDIFKFIAFFDSIIRNKKSQDLKIYIFGNFHRNTNGLVSDVLQDVLLIPYGCTLKIKDNKAKTGENTSRLLFINTKDLYEGVDANSKIGLFGTQQMIDDLLDNAPQSDSNKVGSMAVFYHLKPEYGLLFSEGEDEFVILLSSFENHIDENRTEKNWMLHMETFPTLTVFIHTLYTVEASLKNAYNDNFGVRLTYHQRYRRLIRDLFQMCRVNSLYFSSDVSRKLFTKQLKLWQEEYNLGVSVSFFKSERLKKEGF